MDQYFLIAKVHSAFGNNGFFRIISYSDFPERFSFLKKAYIDFFDNKKEITVEKFKKEKDYFFLKFENFDNDDDVKVLINKKIFITERELVKLPKDYFFIHDLIGSSVYQNNILIGFIKDVLSLTANDVYIIRLASQGNRRQMPDKGEELLIPAVKDFIESFDAKNKNLVLKPGANLYDES